jgi:hypothetical protein
VRIGDAAAHNSRAASKTERAHPVSIRRGARCRPKDAHTEPNEVTDAMFHAPMSALNADADWNACKPSRRRSTPTESVRTVRRG